MEELSQVQIITEQVITMFNFSVITIAKLFLVIVAIAESWDFIKQI